MKEIRKITPQNLEAIISSKALIVDVRTSMEHAEKHLERGHLHVPLDELNPQKLMEEKGLEKDSDIYILCRSGKRALKAAEKFLEDGYTNVHIIEGGLVACEECGHKLQGYGVSGSSEGGFSKRPISLERQVRIAAGIFVVIGAALALVAHPLFVLIPLFVGGGLIFSGVTDYCGLGLLLAKAPWNKMG